MKYLLITCDELDEIIQAAGDQVRGAFGKLSFVEATARLELLECQVEARGVPGYALGWYVIDHNGNPKCEAFAK